MDERPRASLGFDDVLADFDPTEFAPDQATPPRQRPSPEVARHVAAQTGFKSREVGQGGTPPPQPIPTAPTSPVRRRRTGRNAQFNLKARPDTIAAFCAVADHKGWGLGETLEHAVALLEREFLAKNTR